MRLKTVGLGIWLVLAALAIFLPPVQSPPETQVRMIDEYGRDEVCSPAFATLLEPDRSRTKIFAPVDDLAYALVDAGPVGGVFLLAVVLVPIALAGAWNRGLRCGLRRLLVGTALAAPIGLGLLYHSCFLPGRRPVLGPEARLRWIQANFHSQTDRSTGLLRPIDVVRWHRRRGIHVLNICDKDSIEGAREAWNRARATAQAGGPDLLATDPPLLLLLGEEYHGAPDLVLIHAKRSWTPYQKPVQDVIAGVKEEGGAVIVAHPWAKLSRPLTMLLDEGADGAEAVNGMIHGGRHVIEAVVGEGRPRKALVGSLDYKYGPHASAMTLIPRDALPAYDPALPGSAENAAAAVVKALREARTRVLYAIPGNPLTDASWEMQRFGPASALVGLRTLYGSSRSRRVVWLVWVVLVAALWKLGTRRRAPPERTGPWFLVFAACCALEFLVLAPVSWEVRDAIGTIPVNVLLICAAVIAVPLLASVHCIGCERRTQTG